MGLSVGGIVLPITLGQSPGLGTGTRLTGACRGGIWAGGIGLLRVKVQGEKEARHFAKSCARPGWPADGAVLWNQLHVVWRICRTLAARPPRTLVLQSNLISTQPGAIPRSSTARVCASAHSKTRRCVRRREEREREKEKEKEKKKKGQGRPVN